MKNTTQYVGYTKEDDTMHMMIVDLLDLPYDVFSAEKPLHIDADVNMGKGKKAPLPDFSNVIIKGVFDCSDFTISEDSVLPKGITEIICLHSISNLSVLIGKLPKTVTKVVVRPSVLNAVIKNKNNELEIAKQFADTYPNIQVTDDKKLYLSEIIQQKEKPTVTEKVKAQKTETKEKTQLSSKTDDWLSMDEIFEICVTKPAITNLIPKDKIEREIRAAKSKASYIDVTVQKMLRPHDGIAIDCIHSNDVQKIINFIIEKANDRASKQQTEKVKKESKKQPTQTVEQQTIQQPKLYVGTKEVQPTVITKYIKSNIWTKIKGHCGNDTKKLLNFLEEIEAINIQPTDTPGKQVCYIQDNTIKTSLNIKFKSARRLTQSFTTLDDRCRIVWAMKQDTFIAIDFFDEHEKKQIVKYKQSIRQKDDSDIDTSDTVLVSEKIAELKKELEKQQEPQPPIEPAGGVTGNSSTQPKPDTPKTEYKIPTTTVMPTEQKTQGIKKGVKVEQKISLSTKIEYILKQYDIQYKQILTNLADTVDTEQAIKLTEKLQNTLLQKKKYEQYLKQANEAQKILNEIKQNINKDKWR